MVSTKFQESGLDLRNISAESYFLSLDAVGKWHSNTGGVAGTTGSWRNLETRRQ